MPVPDAVSVGLAELAHGSALADYNSQFERNRKHRRLVPISTLLQCLDNPNLSLLQPNPVTSTCPPNHPPNSRNATHTPHPTPPPLVNVDAHGLIQTPVTAMKAISRTTNLLPPNSNRLHSCSRARLMLLWIWIRSSTFSKTMSIRGKRGWDSTTVVT